MSDAEELLGLIPPQEPESGTGAPELLSLVPGAVPEPTAEVAPDDTGGGADELLSLVPDVPPSGQPNVHPASLSPIPSKYPTPTPADNVGVAPQQFDVVNPRAAFEAALQSRMITPLPEDQRAAMKTDPSGHKASVERRMKAAFTKTRGDRTEGRWVDVGLSRPRYIVSAWRHSNSPETGEAVDYGEIPLGGGEVLPVVGPFIYRLIQTEDPALAAELVYEQYKAHAGNILSGDMFLNAMQGLVNVVIAPMHIANMGGQLTDQTMRRKETIRQVAENNGMGDLYDTGVNKAKDEAALSTIAYMDGAPELQGLFELINTVSDPVGAATRVIERPAIEPKGGWYKATRRLSGESVDDYRDRVESLRAPRKFTMVYTDRLPEAYRPMMPDGKTRNPESDERLRRVADIRGLSDNLDEHAGSLFEIGGTLLTHIGNNYKGMILEPMETWAKEPVESYLNLAMAGEIVNLVAKVAAGAWARSLGEEAAAAMAAKAAVPGLTRPLGSPAELAKWGEGFRLSLNPIKISKDLFNTMYDKALASKLVSPAGKVAMRKARTALWTHWDDLMERMGFSRAVELEADARAAHGIDMQKRNEIIETMFNEGILPVIDDTFGKNLTKTQLRQKAEAATEFFFDEMSTLDPRFAISGDLIEDGAVIVEAMQAWYKSGVGNQAVRSGALSALTGKVKLETDVLWKAWMEEIPKAAARQLEARKTLGSWVEMARMKQVDAQLLPFTNPAVLRAAGYPTKIGAEWLSDVLAKQILKGDKFIKRAYKDKAYTNVYEQLTSLRTPRDAAQAIYDAAIKYRTEGVQAASLGAIQRIGGFKPGALGMPLAKRLTKKMGLKPPRKELIQFAKTLESKSLKERRFFDKVRQGSLENMAFSPEHGFQVGATILKDSYMDASSPLHGAVKKIMDGSAFSKTTPAFGMLPRESALELLRKKHANGTLTDFEKALLGMDERAIEAAKGMVTRASFIEAGFEQLRQGVLNNMDGMMARGILDGNVALESMGQYFPALAKRFYGGGFASSLQHTDEGIALATSSRAKTRKGGAEYSGINRDAVASLADAWHDTSRAIRAHDFREAVAIWASNEGLVPGLTKGRMEDVRPGIRDTREYIGDDGTVFTEITRADTKFGSLRERGTRKGGTEKLDVRGIDEDGWFVNPETSATYKMIPKDDKQWGPFAGQLVEQSLWGFMSRGTPEKLGGASGMVMGGLRKIMGHAKAMMVPANIPSVGRNILNNGALMAGTPNGAKSLAHMKNAPKLRQRYLRNDHEGNRWSAMAAEGLEKHTMQSAEFSAVSESAMTSNTRMQELVFDALTTKNMAGRSAQWLTESENAISRSIGHVMGTINKGAVSTKRGLMEFFQASEVTMKGALGLTLWDAKDAFVSGSARVGDILKPLGVTDEAIRRVAVLGVRAEEYPAVIAAYMKATNAPKATAGVRFNAEFGKTPTNAGLPGMYSYWGSTGEKLLAEVNAAVSNVARAAVEYGDLILFNYNRVNGLTEFSRSTLAAVGLVNPFMTWELKAAALTTKWIAATPVYSAMLAQTAAISGDYVATHMAGVTPEEGRQIRSRLSPSEQQHLLAFGIDENPLTGRRQLEGTSSELYSIGSHFDTLEWRKGGKKSGEEFAPYAWMGKLAGAVPDLFVPGRSGLYKSLFKDGKHTDGLDVLQAVSALLWPPFLTKAAINHHRATLGLPKRSGTALKLTPGEALADAAFPISIERHDIGDINLNFGNLYKRATGEIRSGPIEGAKEVGSAAGQWADETDAEYAERMKAVRDSAAFWGTGVEGSTEAGKELLNRIRFQMGQGPVN